MADPPTDRPVIHGPFREFLTAALMIPCPECAAPPLTACVVPDDAVGGYQLHVSRYKATENYRAAFGGDT